MKRPAPRQPYKRERYTMGDLQALVRGALSGTVPAIFKVGKALRVVFCFVPAFGGWTEDPDFSVATGTQLDPLYLVELPAEKNTLMLPYAALVRGVGQAPVLPYDLADLCLSLREMRRWEYPIHSCFGQELTGDWVETEFSDTLPKLFGLDCEFCDTAKGQELTRISVVDAEGTVIVSRLVKPRDPIVDYGTKFSGVTAEMLEGVTTTREDVCGELLGLIAAQDYVCGQSLDHDLRVLRLRHPRVIDTSLLYDHPLGLPRRPRLRTLAQDYLGRAIQAGEATGAGHSPDEDLLASLDLVKLKMEKGYFFGSRFEHLTLFGDINGCIVDSDPSVYHVDAPKLVGGVDTALQELETRQLVVMRLASVDELWEKLPAGTLLVGCTEPKISPELRLALEHQRRHPHLPQADVRHLVREAREAVAFARLK